MTPMLAARAYAAIQNGGVRPQAPGVGAGDHGLDFGSMVSNAMNDVVNASRTAETKMTAHSQGKAELVDVVTSIASAQASLETMMAVRDQVISAYQQVMNMPI